MNCPGGCGKTLDIRRSNALVLLSTFPDPNWPRRELETIPLCGWCARRIVHALERGTSLTPIVLRSPRPRFYHPPKEDMSTTNMFTCDWNSSAGGPCDAREEGPAGEETPNRWSIVTFDDGAVVREVHLCPKHSEGLRDVFRKRGT